MKTIAISIDDRTLATLDRLARKDVRGRKNRSEIFRRAIEELAQRLEREEREERDAAAYRRHKKQFAREAAALIAEQARHGTR
jgi:metal-responsive CopG/Arc/MetJ family transcriptional regulator